MGRPWSFEFTRRELKFPLPSGAWPHVLDCAARYLPVMRDHGGGDFATVRTVYLDSPQLESYCEYVADSPIRKKIRVRQYGSGGSLNGLCWVEIKIKRYGDCFKRRFCCTTDSLLRFMTGQDILLDIEGLNAGHPNISAVYRAARALLMNRGLGPVVRVDFERCSFQDAACQEVRMTVDRGIRFGDPHRTRQVAHDGTVLEIKYTGNRPPWVADFLAELKIERASRFSKFAQAIQALGAEGLARKHSA